MATSELKLNEALKAKYFEVVANALLDNGEEVLQTGSAEIAIPVVDEAGNDKFLVITIKVPKGSRDGEPYDGYSMAQDYTIKVKATAEKKAAQAKAKAEKIKRDEEYRRKVKENKEKAISES